MRELRISADHHVVYELLSGAPDGRPIIVLLNGSLFNFHQWDLLLKRGFSSKSKREYCIVRYDYGGTGLSWKGSIVWNVEALADELGALVDHLGGSPVNLYGMSKGTAVAQIFAVRYPQLTTSVAGYGWFNFRSATLPAVQRFFAERLSRFDFLADAPREPLTRPRFEELWRFVEETVLTQTRAQYNPLMIRAGNRLLKRRIYALLRPTAPRTMYDWFAYVVNEIGGGAGASAMRYENLAEVPFLIQHAVRDGTLPVAMARELAAALPRADLREYGKGFNHVSVAIRPSHAAKVISDYLQWLGKAAGRAAEAGS